MGSSCCPCMHSRTRGLEACGVGLACMSSWCLLCSACRLTPLLCTCCCCRPRAKTGCSALWVLRRHRVTGEQDGPKVRLAKEKKLVLR